MNIHKKRDQTFAVADKTSPEAEIIAHLLLASSCAFLTNIQVTIYSSNMIPICRVFRLVMSLKHKKWVLSKNIVEIFLCFVLWNE